jgi:hypothetical protein
VETLWLSHANGFGEADDGGEVVLFTGTKVRATNALGRVQVFSG